MFLSFSAFAVSLVAKNQGSKLQVFQISLNACYMEPFEDLLPFHFYDDARLVAIRC